MARPGDTGGRMKYSVVTDEIFLCASPHSELDARSRRTIAKSELEDKADAAAVPRRLSLEPG
jgi:hypothetical protein